jgi:hypothetical protein
MPIPTKFEPTHVLAPSTYEATFAELRNSLLVHGDGSSPTWDSQWREHLVSNLEILVKQLWQAGMSEIFIDGSFVENKDHPNDIDGYIDTGINTIDPVSMQSLVQKVSTLNSLDHYKVWTREPKSRVFDPNTGKGQLPMWIRYRVELYLHIEGLFSGIKDKFGNNMQFPSAFRQSRREFIEKGIVKIIQ